MHADLVALLARPIAHRGLHSCGAPGPVENSIGAALAAVAAGYAIECDVGLSRDGEAMVFHDEELARLTGMPGRLGDHDAADLRRLALGGGDHIPTLGEFLAAIDGRAPLVIEIKSDGDIRLTERTLALVADYPGPVAVESFDPGVVLYCRARQVPPPVGLVGPADSGAAPDPALIAVCDFASWSIDDLASIAARHPTLPRTTWTVRTLAQAAHARDHSTQIVFEGFSPLPGVKGGG